MYGLNCYTCGKTFDSEKDYKKHINAHSLKKKSTWSKLAEPEI